MDLFALASRNLRRNGRRTLLSGLTIVAGVMALLLFAGYVASLLRGIEVETVRTQGHLQISRPGFLRQGSANPSLFAIAQPQQLINSLRQDPVLQPLVRVITPRLHVQGIAGNARSGISRTFIGTGVMPADEHALRQWAADALRPTATSALDDDVPDGGVLGAGLAEGLDLCHALALPRCEPIVAAAELGAGPRLPDDIARLASAERDDTLASLGSTRPTIDLLAASSSGAPNVVRMQVLGAQRLGMREMDNLFASMPIGLAQRLVDGVDNASATAIVVQLHDTRQLRAARNRIAALLKQSRVAMELHDFKAVNPRYGQVVHLFGTIFGFVSVLVAVVSMFGIANAIAMSVGERTREIGTLRALGWTRRRIRALFVAEGAILGTGGAIVGLAAAAIVAAVINRLDLSWVPPGHVDAIALRIDLLRHPAAVTLTCAALALLVSLSAWWPAHRASRMEIVEALRHA